MKKNKNQFDIWLKRKQLTFTKIKSSEIVPSHLVLFREFFYYKNAAAGSPMIKSMKKVHLKVYIGEKQFENSEQHIEDNIKAIIKKLDYIIVQDGYLSCYHEAEIKK